MDRALADQWAVVTGGSKGIGFGVAQALVEAGAHVVLVARNEADLDDARAALASSAASGQRIVTKAADVSDPAAVGALFEWVRDDLPRLNVAVVNAGSGALVPFLDESVEHWNDTMALNLTGAFLCIQGAAKVMVGMPGDENRSIVAISSIRALGVRPGLVSYAATKAALNSVVRTAAYELAATGIRVNAVSPGITATPLMVSTLEAQPDLLNERTRDIPMGRPGSLADMARTVRFLCEPGSAFVTGANIVVDGGESLY